jgi:Flp pilus assembly protein TadB
MIVSVVLGVAILAGAPWQLVVVGAALGVAPIPATAVLGIIAVVDSVRRRLSRPDSESEADLYRSLAGAVSAGETLHGAIRHADHPSITPSVIRLCSVGAPIGEVGAELASSLPTSGRSFAALCAMSELTGSSLVDALERLAERAEATVENQRKRRVSLAQTRLSAWVVGVAPLALTMVVLVSRGIPEPGGALVAVPIAVGAVMQIAGTLVVFTVSGRAVR